MHLLFAAGLLMTAQATDVGLSHHWKLDDAASPAVDAVGTIDGVWTNGPVRQTTGLPPAFAGVANLSCLRFDGTNDFVNLGTDLDLARNLPAVSLAYWANMDTGFGISGGLSIAVGPPPGTSADSRVSLVIRADGVLRAAVRAADGNAQVNLDSPAGTVVADAWAHYAAVVDYANDTMRLYKNGNEVAATTTANFTPTATSNTHSKNAAIGSSDAGGGDRHRGRMDDVRIYDRALTLADVRTLCTPVAPPTLAAAGDFLEVELTWTVAPDLPASFNVYRSATSGSGYVLLAAGVTGTTYVDGTAPTTAPSYYVVTALGVRESPFSPEASATAVVPPPRTNSHEEGLLGDRCACGSSVPGPIPFPLLFALAGGMLMFRRRPTPHS